MAIATGLKNIHYRVMVSDDVAGVPVYGPDYTLPEAVELNFNTASSMTSFFADNKMARSAASLGEKSITLNVADIPPADMARLLGIPYNNGVLQYFDTINPPYVTIAANTTFDDGTVGYVRYYKVMFGYPNDADKTQVATVEYRPISIEGRVLGLQSSTYDGLHKIKVRDDDGNHSASFLTNFLTDVQYATSDLGALSAAISKSTTKTRYTFTKVGGGNITLTASQLNATNLPIFSAGVAEPGAYSITSGNGTATVVVDFTPTVAYSGGEVISASVSPNSVFDQNGVACGVANEVLTY